MNIGNRILQLRKKNGLSQEALAEKLNISRQAVSRWETGEAIPETEKVVQLSRIFRVSTDCLLMDEDENLPDTDAVPPAEEEPLSQVVQPVEPAETSIPVKTGWPALLKWAAGFALTGFVFGLVAIVLAGVFSDSMNEWYTDYGRFGTALLFTWRAAFLYIGLGLMAVGLVLAAVYAALKWKPAVLVLMFFTVFMVAFSVVCSGIALGAPALLLVIALLVFLLVMWANDLARKHRAKQTESGKTAG